MNVIDFYPGDRVVLAMLVFWVTVGGVALARLIIFSVIDTLAMWANGYWGTPKRK